MIEAVPIVPRTLSGKKLELPVKRILGGAPADTVASRDSLADPASLDYFVSRASRRGRSGNRVNAACPVDIPGEVGDDLDGESITRCASGERVWPDRHITQIFRG